jgi:hypothetical protein
MRSHDEIQAMLDRIESTPVNLSKSGSPEELEGMAIALRWVLGADESDMGPWEDHA